MEPSSNFEDVNLIMEWKESKTDNAATVIYIPHLYKLKNDEMKSFSIEKFKDSDAGYLIVPTAGMSEIRTLDLTLD